MDGLLNINREETRSFKGIIWTKTGLYTGLYTGLVQDILTAQLQKLHFDILTG